MNKNDFPTPKSDAIISALEESGLSLSPEIIEAVQTRVDSLLFHRPGLWRAWQFSAVSGMELRDFVVQHSHRAIEKFTKGKIAFDHFAALNTAVELALFGSRLAGDEPENVDESDVDDAQ